MSYDILFEECKEALKHNIAILSKEDSDKMWAEFKEKVPLLFWGRIDRKGLDQSIVTDQKLKIIPVLSRFFQRSFDTSMYVFWNDASLPVIKTDLDSALEAFDDVVAVAPDTWFVNFAEGYVVELFHGGEIVVGLLPR